MRLSAQEEQKLLEREARHWWHVAKRAYLKTLLQKAGFVGTRVLDLGSASGAVREVVPPGARLIHTDVTLHFALRALPSRLKVVCDAENLPFRAQSFDLVIAADVLEHLQRPEVASKEILTALRPGGVFLVTVPAWPALFSAHDEALGHFRRYTQTLLQRTLEASGFRVDLQTYLFGSLLPAVVMRRFLSPPGRPEPRTSYDSLPRVLNAACLKWFLLENWLLRFFSLPFGSSVAAVARRI